MHIKTEGIVLKEAPYGDNGKLLTILTPELGKIMAQAKGARSLKSKLAVSSNIFTYSKFEIFKNKERYVVDHGEVIEIFYELRNDLAKLSLAQYFLELVSYISHEDMDCADILKLLSNTLFILAKKDKPLPLIKAVFELKLLEFAGFMPDLEGCRQCSESEADIMYLNVQEGYIICGKCKNAEDNIGKIPVNESVLKAMRHILYGDFAKLFSFTLNDDSLTMLERIVEKFLNAHIEYKFETLEFYKKL